MSNPAHADVPLVVETDPLPPAEQLKKFHLPPGFEIQLVAANPVIGQPMNLNFDAAGRLWATHSLEYPFPAMGEGIEDRDANFQGTQSPVPRDRLTVFSGIDHEGRPSETTVFWGGMNIPIGHLPLVGAGQIEAIVYSIPNIQRVRDTDGDGRGDAAETLYGRFGNVDTHGMANSFTRGNDGWVYGCHGFRNTSNVKGQNGQGITMNSGNTYRFRIDGSKIEQWSWGQVNPFGLAFDRFGNMYTADCHSKPITCILRGGYYQSFGKPHDGLGFAPDMIDHSHGSTGICGVAFLETDTVPADWRGNVLICNPVNGQVHRDKVEWHGSSPMINSQPDFLTCDDQWFRPVDVKLGPDGAIYVADFYNCIIGHYEVPLKHPRRDRELGRIWRIVPTGGPQKVVAPANCDLTKLSAAELAIRLGDPNLTTRMLATNLIVDKFATEAAGLARQILTKTDSPAEQRAHAVHVLFRTQPLNGEADDDRKLLATIANDPSALMRTHLARCLADVTNWTPSLREVAVRLQQDRQPESANVRRAATEAIGLHPAVETMPLLLAGLEQVDSQDTHLLHVIRMAIRNHLRDPAVVRSLAPAVTASAAKSLLEFGLAVNPPSPELAALLTASLASPAGQQLSSERRRVAWQHVARYSAPEQRSTLLTTADAACGNDLARAQETLRALADGFVQQGTPPETIDPLRIWATHVATELLRQKTEQEWNWTALPLPDHPPQDDPFVPQLRKSADEDQSLFFCSLVKGEQRTGVLQSSPFVLPAQFSFFIAGHNDLPNVPAQPRNRIRLIDSQTHETLAETLPPRNDLAQRVEWDLQKLAGRTGFLEIIDGDDRGSFAWLAVGRFSIPQLNPGSSASAVQSGCQLAAQLKLQDLKPELTAIVRATDQPIRHRRAAAESLQQLVPDARLAVLIPFAGDLRAAENVRESVFQAVIDRDNQKELPQLLKTVCQQLPWAEQKLFAERLASDHGGAESLLQLVSQGFASPRLLQQPALLEKLRTHQLERFDERLQMLTAGLPPENAEIEKRIAQRRQEYQLVQDAPAAAERGKAIFQKQCANCHAISGQGQKIGPQLDGIGVRGLNRLLEDVLDPNRNVDGAFRATNFLLTDGRTLSGLIRREEGETLIAADNLGKDFTVRKSEIEQQKISQLSLMPTDMAEKIPVNEFNDLFAYLLQTATKK